MWESLDQVWVIECAAGGIVVWVCVCAAYGTFWSMFGGVSLQQVTLWYVCVCVCVCECCVWESL